MLTFGHGQTFIFLKVTSPVEEISISCGRGDLKNG